MSVLINEYYTQLRKHLYFLTQWKICWVIGTHLYVPWSLASITITEMCRVVSVVLGRVLGGGLVSPPFKGVKQMQVFFWNKISRETVPRDANKPIITIATGCLKSIVPTRTWPSLNSISTCNNVDRPSAASSDWDKWWPGYLQGWLLEMLQCIKTTKKWQRFYFMDGTFK